MANKNIARLALVVISILIAVGLYVGFDAFALGAFYVVIAFLIAAMACVAVIILADSVEQIISIAIYGQPRPLMAQAYDWAKRKVSK